MKNEKEETTDTQLKNFTDKVKSIKEIRANPEENNKKITQLFVDINPKEEINDYYKVTVKNIESLSGEKIDSEEYGVIQINNFNKFIKM